MTKNLQHVAVDTGLWQCLGSMRQIGMDALPVFEGEHLVGLVVEDDIVRALRVGVESGNRSFARDVMKTRVFCFYEDQNPNAVIGTMEKSGERHAFVLDRSDSLIGMIRLDREQSTDATPGWLC